MPLALKFPLSIGITRDFKDVDTDLELAKFHIKNVIFTNPGERISNPAFGVGIRQYLFEYNLDSVRSTLASAIRSQIFSYVPNVNVSNVQVSEIDENSIYVRIEFNLIGQSVTTLFETNVTTGDMSSVSY